MNKLFHASMQNSYGIDPNLAARDKWAFEELREQIANDNRMVSKCSAL